MEELIIRVKIDGFQGGAEEGGSGGQGVGGAAGLGIAAGIAARNNSLPQVAAKATFKGAVRAEKKLIRKFNKHGFHGVLAEDIDTELLSQRQGIFTLNTEIRAQLIGAPRGTIMDYTTRQFQGSLAHEFLMQERAKFTPQVMRAAAGAAA